MKADRLASVRRQRRCAPLYLVLGLALLVSCHREAPPPGARPRVAAPAPPPKEEAQALIVVETPAHQTEAKSSADEHPQPQALKTLLAHFDVPCDITTAADYRRGQVERYRYAFYLAAGAAGGSSANFVADLGVFEGVAVWVGPGVGHLGGATLAKMRLAAASTDEMPAPEEWLLSYRGQEHAERASVPGVTISKAAKAVAHARSNGRRRVFMAGDEEPGGGAAAVRRRWYAAAGPSLDPAHVWTACIWADALHDILGIAHREHRRLVPTLRDVPVWVTDKQVPDAARPMLEAGLPVAVLAHTQMQDTALADRPLAVKSLRAAEAMGGTVVLWADSELDAGEHLHLAWEVGLHPVAWAGPAGEGNPFRLRIADEQHSPPFAAGGILPVPIAISDAGYIAKDDLARLRMQLVVRDAVALLSFGLWAPRDPFLEFVRRREGEGWRRADLRDLGVVVSDPRRLMVSGSASVHVPWRTGTRQRVMGPRWDIRQEDTIPAAGSAGQTVPNPPPPEGCVAVLEPSPGPARRLAGRETKQPSGGVRGSAFVKGVTLDPWPYGWQGLSAKVLAESMAERYARNGVNTVFFYAYNVKQGAAYWTRYPGAMVSEWGRRDLLKEVLEACHARHIRVVAWMYSGRDRTMWTKHPSWRERTKEGRPYNPLRLHATYFLCPRNPQVREWYVGLLRDLAQRYPTLDGIELSEPLVNWWGDTACYCDVCKQDFAAHCPGKPLGGPEWRERRRQALTEFMAECMRAISENGLEAYVLTICDAWSNGALLTPKRQAEESGFDLEGLLESRYPPDWVNFEVIWQQWAAIYGTQIFNYDWAAETAQRLKNRVDGRAKTIIHVEITDFGKQRMTPEKTAETIRHVLRADPEGVECYHSAALDRKSAWTVLRRAYEEIK